MRRIVGGEVWEEQEYDFGHSKNEMLLAIPGQMLTRPLGMRC